MSNEINIQEVMRTKKTWKKEFNSLYDYFKESIGEDNECFEKTVDLRLMDGSLVRMGLNNYLSNLIMWRPSIKFKIPITLDMIFETSNIRSNNISDYINTRYVRPMRCSVDLKTLNIEPAIIIEHAKKIVEDFGLIMGLSYNMKTISDLRDEYEELDEIFNSNIPEGLQPIEIEEYGVKQRKKLISILEKSNTSFKPFLRSGAAFKDGQFQELLATVCNKPDLEGNTMPVPINTNLGIKGLDTPGHYLLDAKGGRKALVFNKKYTGKSGYFSRKLNLLASNIRISKSHVHDCHTNQYLKFEIKSKESLKRIEGKYYKMVPEKKYIRSIKFDDEWLIGKTVLLRSASKCKCKDGICEICFGELAKIIGELNAGIIAGSIISERFTQNILSSKRVISITTYKKMTTLKFFNCWKSLISKSAA